MATITVRQNILGRNEEIAAENSALFARYGIYALNLLGSPGSGKTSLLEKTLGQLKGELRLAVIEGDLFTSKDADRIARHDVPVVQINTSGGCHLDAAMVRQACGQLALDEIDILLVENVGNLVCPAEFYLGEDDKGVVLSITEGDDKPLKYPLIFKESAIALLNKIDILPYTDFDLATAKDDLLALKPSLTVLATSCTSGEGLLEWCAWLKNKARAKKLAAGKGAASP